MNTNTQLSTQEKYKCEQLITELAKQTDGIVGCVVASVDGFVVAEVNQKGNSGNRLAAMSSSTTALANAIIGELNLGLLNTIIVESDIGKVIVLSITTKKQDLALMCVCNDKALMGQVLFSTKSAVKKIASIFEETSSYKKLGVLNV